MSDVPMGGYTREVCEQLEAENARLTALVKKLSPPQNLCTDTMDCCNSVGQYGDHYPNPNCDCPFHSNAPELSRSELLMENARLTADLSRYASSDGSLAERDALKHNLEQALDRAAGHGEPCYYCGKPINNLAGNPRLWSMGLCHTDEPGRVKLHHVGCVSDRLAERDALRAPLDFRHADFITKQFRYLRIGMRCGWKIKNCCEDMGAGCYENGCVADAQAKRIAELESALTKFGPAPSKLHDTKMRLARAAIQLRLWIDRRAGAERKGAEACTEEGG